MRESNDPLWGERPDGPPSVLVLTRDRALASWLVASTLEPLHLAWRVVAEAPRSPRAAVAVCALGPVQAREQEALQLAEDWSIPIVVLLGRMVHDPSALEEAGVLPLSWPYAPSQVRDALLMSLGRDPATRLRPPPWAPRVCRPEEHRGGFGN
jgi:hypothetical protein